jgi:glycosyltransferase involved in cell wall biosynthesis
MSQTGMGEQQAALGEHEPEVVLAGHGAAALRVLVFTEHLNATCHISFERPFRLLHARGSVDFAIASQRRVKTAGQGSWKRWIAEFEPDVVVLSRYGLPHGPAIVRDAKQLGAAVIYHIDDDLLEIPQSLSAGVVQVHGAADVVAARAAMLAECDLVYASTPHLAAVLAARLPGQRVVHGDIYCSYEALPAAAAQPQVIGYMGSRGHQHDLDLAVPAIARVLDERPAARFEVFGSIQMPERLARFGERVGAHPVQPSYPDFLKALAGLGWSMGLAPLVDEPFNRCKAPTKYIEYTSAGIPSIASRSPVYGEVIVPGAGALVDGGEDWYRAITAWLGAPADAQAALSAAKLECSARFSPDRLARQVENILAGAVRDAPAVAVEVSGAHVHPLVLKVMQSSLRRRCSRRVRLLVHHAARPGQPVVRVDASSLVLGDLSQPGAKVEFLGSRGPWLSARHRAARHWVAELAQMLREGEVTWTELHRAVQRGEVRPSLLPELKWSDRIPIPLRWASSWACSVFDLARGFRPQRAMAEA